MSANPRRSCPPLAPGTTSPVRPLYPFFMIRDRDLPPTLALGLPNVTTGLERTLRQSKYQ